MSFCFSLTSVEYDAKSCRFAGSPVNNYEMLEYSNKDRILSTRMFPPVTINKTDGTSIARF